MPPFILVIRLVSASSRSGGSPSMAMVNQLASVNVEGRAPGEKGTSRKLPQGSGEVWKSCCPTRNPQVDTDTDTDTGHPPTHSPTHPG